MAFHTPILLPSLQCLPPTVQGHRSSCKRSGKTLSPPGNLLGRLECWRDGAKIRGPVSLPEVLTKSCWAGRRAGIALLHLSIQHLCAVGNKTLGPEEGQWGKGETVAGLGGGQFHHVLGSQKGHATHCFQRQEREEGPLPPAFTMSACTCLSRAGR